MLYSFNDAKAPTTRQIQYFEMLGNRAIWYKGWKAVTYHGRLPWESGSKWTFDEDKWELYNVEEDFSECHDLGDKNPQKLRALVEMWWAEAGKYNMLPLDDRTQERLLGRAELEKEKTSYTFYPGTVRIPEGSAPHIVNRSYTITTEVEIPANAAQGPICAIGGISSGWSLYIKDDLLVYCHNYLGKRTYTRSTKEVPTGKKVKLCHQFEKIGKEKFGAGGIGRLYINNEKVGEDQIPTTMKFRYSVDESFDIGRDSASPVSEEYKTGAQFTGENIEKVIVDLAGEKHIDHEAQTRIIMKRQ